MVEPEDLLGKADALMARHRPARTTVEPYAEIPVLHEVVEFPRDSSDPPPSSELPQPAPPDEERIDALAARMRASLLAALQPGIDSLIEERLKQGLAERVERVFDDLRGDLQLIAREILSDAIHTAVEQELERRRSDS
jgi:hypothetical protein